MTKLLVLSPISHDGKEFKPGDKFEGSDDVVTPLIVAGALEDPDRVKTVTESAGIESAKAEAEKIRDDAAKDAEKVHADAAAQAESIVSDAKSAAEKITADAKADAEKIVKDAQDAAAKAKTPAQSK